MAVPGARLRSSRAESSPERLGLTTTDAAPGQTDPRRKFIRHTAGVPIEVRAVDGMSARLQESVNVSAGGLSFVSEADFAPETVLLVRIPEVDPPFEAQARVAWSRPEGQRFCIGVQFLDASDAFRARMVEQVCSIERYRREVEEREGRALSVSGAAAEWIRKYAGRFPE
ncbi:MAG: PilZ domain-containing protein [Gemmatimonadetes bacterium]|nr:PilZ domain-containing protein [Gemmatimonadota bacterium]